MFRSSLAALLLASVSANAWASQGTRPMLSRLLPTRSSSGRPRAEHMGALCGLGIGLILAVIVTWLAVASRQSVINDASREMRNLALMEVKGRVADTLLEIANVFGTSKNKYIAVAISRQDISAYAGTTYETVFRLLRSMLQDKIISVSGKTIRINDMEKLKKMVQNAK